MSKQDEFEEIAEPYVLGVAVKAFRMGFMWGLILGCMFCICAMALIKELA